MLATFSYQLLLLLFLVALLAGFIDSIAGGGGLLTLPVLLACGLTPAQALATNKLQSSGGSFSASLYFVQRGVVDLWQLRWVIGSTFLGATIGTLLVTQIDAGFLRVMLPLLTIGMGLYFLLAPSLSQADRPARLSLTSFAFAAALPVGFYDGFFGPGAGMFYALIHVTLLGFNLTKATAHAKVLNFTSNLAALLFFMLGGHVLWLVGLVMLCGQFIGARLGARMVLRNGRKLIRPMLIAVSSIMSLKLLYDTFI